MHKIGKIKHIYHSIEKLPESRRLHIAAGILVVSFAVGLGIGGIDKAYRVENLKKWDQKQRQERLNRIKTLLSRAEGNLQYSISGE